MIQLILFLLVAAVLFVSLYFLARHSSGTEGNSKTSHDARLLLSSLQNGLLPPELVARIFATDDLDFITAQNQEGLESFFLAERKRVALSWILQVRNHTLNLRRFHNTSARFYARLNLAAEIRLAADFQMLLLACRLLEAIVRVGGPFAVPSFIGSTTAMANRICAISDRSLEVLNPALAGVLESKAGEVRS